MAQFSQRQPISAQASTSTVKGWLSDQQSLTLRRLLAWGLEASLLVGSVTLPWALGEAVRQRSDADLVPLNPAASLVQGAIARAVGWSRPTLITEVPPLTNLLWLGALGLPVVLVGSQIHSLGKTGKTWPKAWLGLQVVTPDSPMPGYGVAVKRELSRWGVPTVIAYGLWVGSGAFPALPWLGGLVVVCSLGQGMTALTSRSRRSFHDHLAGTRVVLLRGGQIPLKYRPEPSDSPGVNGASAYGFGPNGFVTSRGMPLVPRSLLTITEEYGGLRAVVLAPPDPALGATQPQGWRRYLTLPVVGGIAGVLALAAVGGLWLSRDRALQPMAQQQDDLFLALVENLSQKATSFSDRQAAALALASTQDPRAITLLVDMLAQTGDPALLDTLQQALVTMGLPAIPPLQRLNLALANDIVSLPPEQQMIPRLRQRTIKRTLAKILVLHSGNLQDVDLSGTQLGYVVDSPDAFTLVLEQQNLAGVSWRNALLAGARLRKAIFFDPGPDGRKDTFDDWITDFSGSDLTEASLVAAELRHTLFRNTSLLRANLSNAQAAYANFSGANASSTRFIAADVSHGQFKDTSLVGADLTEARLDQASFVDARLREATLAWASLIKADLSHADLTDTNLTGADLSGARLVQADLSYSLLQGADLTDANLENADLQNTNLEGVILAGANLAGANFDGAQFVTPERPQADSFITTSRELEQGEALAGADFSQARNLRGEQLTYICLQGGLHPACSTGF
ncbi:MAG: hypothetical protein EA342_10100 [Leptolyngbya sp. LCM1.Bin17]|nr:MAG: hypothetical protein EA342_10100 [Leptolyngbya sp. LCM1.Bin17]